MMHAYFKAHSATSVTPTTPSTPTTPTTSIIAVPVIRRIGAGTFWTLLAVEGLLIAFVLAWGISVLPTRTPIQTTNNLPRLQAAIMDRVSGAVADPLIEVRPGVSIRSSNVRGLSLNGVTYFYYLEGQANYDPYSRGAVPAGSVEFLLRDTSGPQPLVVYTIHA